MNRLMNRQGKLSSRDLGLELASVCGRHFLKLEHLHYGFWPDGLQVDIANLRTAQDNYTDFLVSHIPDGVETILDVGCGTGGTAKRLVDLGYKVDCVSPSPFLAGKVRSILPDSKIFECPYEMLQTNAKYDLIMFSESFQYINIEKSLQQTSALLNSDGYLLICDVFKKDITAKNVMGGGHKLAKFYHLIADFPFCSVTDLDITDQTAPSLDILDDAMKNVVAPLIDSGLGFLSARYPFTLKLLRWKYKKQINKVYEKYCNGRRTSDDFKKFKTYKLLLFKKGLVTQAVTTDHPALLHSLPAAPS
jgi:SAM-dependent methyltransferase